MQVNVVKIPEDSDFQKLRDLSDQQDGWTLVYTKKKAQVWTRPSPDPNSTFNMIRARTEFSDVPDSMVYDVLHDPVYREEWDKYMMEGKDIGLLNCNNDVCYYAVRSPPPLRHRDFVLQRSWLDLGDEKLIFNHSVCHDDYLPRKNCVRAISFLTGYLIRSLGPNSCQVTYVTHSDPRGKLPSWLINKITQIVTPKMMKRLHKACLNYPAWKNRHEPDWRPWSRPDQQSELRIDLRKCQPRDYGDVIDESNCGELALPDEQDDPTNSANGNSSSRSSTPLPSSAASNA